MKKKSKIAITIAAIAAMVSIISKDKKTKEVCKCEEDNKEPLE